MFDPIAKPTPELSVLLFAKVPLRVSQKICFVKMQKVFFLTI